MTSFGLRHLAIRVKDAQRSKRFYTDVMGMTVEWEPDPQNVYLTTGGQDNLALHESPEFDGNIGGLDHFGFFVAAPDEVDGWCKRVQEAKATVVQLPKTHRDGARSFYFKDPDGYVVQILFHRPIAERALKT